jgi:hypothetical protein
MLKKITEELLPTAAANRLMGQRVSGFVNV